MNLIISNKFNSISQQKIGRKRNIPFQLLSSDALLQVVSPFANPYPTLNHNSLREHDHL